MIFTLGLKYNSSKLAQAAVQLKFNTGENNNSDRKRMLYLFSHASVQSGTPRRKID